MKISSTLMRTVRLVIAESNGQERNRVRAEFARREKVALNKSGAGSLITQHNKLQKRIDRLVRNQQSVTAKLSDMGFYTDGTIKYAERLGIPKMEPKLINDDAVLAKLARATDAEGAAILQELGIKQ